MSTPAAVVEDKHAQAEPLPAMPAPRVPARMGVAPQSVEEAWRLSNLVSTSDLVPKDFRGKPANVLIAIQIGLEIGIPWMQALQGTAVINGRPSFFGDLFLAIIMASPLYADHDEYYEVKGERRSGLVPEDWKHGDTAAVCTFWRRGKETPTTRRFTVEQARKAGLLGKEGPWTNYPDRMLAMRARGFGGRDTFPDVLKGIRSAEELIDTPEEVEAPVTPAIPPPSEVKRISETVTPPTTVVQPPVVAEVTLGPAKVKDVEEVVGAFFLRLAGDPVRIAIEHDKDRRELEGFIGTDHAIKVVTTSDGKALTLKSFSIAD